MAKKQKKAKTTWEKKQSYRKKVGGIDPSKAPKPETEKERPQKTGKYKGGGLAGMRRFNRGGKV